jgi:PHD/YefM family antitoxin component YafN of YafNO toxin-antitoxin module
MITTIQLDSKLKEKLDSLKIHHRETYNELISRLIIGRNNLDTESLIETIEILSDPELMIGIKEALEEEQRGEKATSLDELKKELGL